MTEFEERTGEEFKPLDVPSMVRSRKYQGLLDEVNAQTNFPSHLTGQAFDVSYLSMTDQQRKYFELVLEDLGDMGHISYAIEGDCQKCSKTYHIVVAPFPDSQKFFTQVYDEAWGVHLVREEARRKQEETKRKARSN